MRYKPLVDSDNLILTSLYNRGARDMAIIFINTLQRNRGKLLGCKKSTEMQYLKLLKDVFTQPGHPALNFLMLQEADGSFPNLHLHYDDKGNMVKISMEGL